MNATILRCNDSSVHYINLIIHECNMFEFKEDLRKEIRRFIKEKEDKEQVGTMDVFWHLDDYCEKKYGVLHWQTIEMDELRIAPVAKYVEP